MSAFSKLLGTIGSFFTFGPTGPGINANGAALETKNNANAAFAVHRGAPPVAANDFVTLGSLPGLGGVVSCISVTPGIAATTTSTAQIPAGALVVDCRLLVTTPYSAGGTIEVGIAGTLADFMGTGDNDAQLDGLYDVPQQTTVGGASAVVVTVGGAPGAGVSVVVVFFVVPVT
jgi:hypothetical protein